MPTLRFEAGTFTRMVVGTVATMVISASAQSALAQDGSGNWHVKETASALDGQKNYLAIVESEEKLTNIIGQPEAAGLALSCGKDGYFVNILWPDFVENDFHEYKIYVRWKLDDGAIQKTKWVASSQGVFLMGNGGMAWTKALASAKKLVVEVPDQHGGQAATFDLDGVGDVYAAVAARSCP